MVGFIPIPVLAAVGILLVFHYVLTETRLGRQMFAVGGNLEASELFGLPVRRTKLVAFLASGMLASLSGIIVAARLAAASPVVGQGWELIAITGAVLGGISLFGGRGTIPGIILGALVLEVLNNGLSILGVSPFYSQLTMGVLIFAVVLIDLLRTLGPPK